MTVTEPTSIHEELTEVVRALLAQWLHHNGVGMTVLEYVAAGRTGMLEESIATPYRELFDR